MTIQLRINQKTQKKDIIISLESDMDSLPHEHDQQHRSLVDKLLEGGLVKAEEVGNIIVEREKVKSGTTIVEPTIPQKEVQKNS